MQDRIATLIDELVFFQAELLSLQPGWSDATACELPLAQRVWLDPFAERAGSPRIDADDAVDEIAGMLDRVISWPGLGGIRDHLQLGAMATVPATAQHRMLRRVQAKSSPARLRRRQMNRHGLTDAEALARVPDTAAERLRLPFLQMRSASTGQIFRLFLELGAPQAEGAEGSFNAYGLSTSRPVPWF